MKDKKKIIVPLLLAGVTATGVVSNVAQVQQYNVQAETSDIANVVGAEIKVGRFQSWNEATKTLVNTDTFKVGDRVYLPNVNLESGFTAVYTIKKDKKEFTPTLVEAGKDGIEEGDARIGSYYFDAEYQGYYDITISAEKDGHVTTTLTNLSVFVERETATIKLPTNSKYIIPAKMQKSQAGLKIPAPTVVYDDENGEEVEEKVNALTQGRTFKVYLVTPTEEVELSLDSTNSYYEVTDATKLSKVGTYHVVYEYKDDTTVISRLENSFQVVEKYDTSNIKLKMKFQSSMPSKGNVNTDISIPKVTVVDENVSSSDAVNAYVEVIVKDMKTGTILPVNYENYTFHPTEEGQYSVTYKASIELFGTDCKTGEVTPGDPIVVSDSQAPSLIPTYEYEFVDGEITKVNGETVTPTSSQTQREAAEEMLVNRKVDIPSVAIKGQEITIPAVYATDNFYKYSDQTDDIVITRSYRSSTGTTATISEQPNKEGKITFNETGNAEIRYEAYDKAGNKTGQSVYTIVVYNSAEDLKDGKTTIKLNVGTTLISDKEKTLTFAKPTATDTYDKNVDVKTYLVYGTDTTNYKTNGTLLNKTNSDGKYEINISDIPGTYNQFTIVAEATVDKVLEGTRGATSITTTKSHTVTIQKVNEDTNVPTFNLANTGDWNTELLSLNSTIKADSTGTTINNAGYLTTDGTATIPVTTGSSIMKAPFDQSSEKIEIPAVEFHDQEDANLSISIEIKDRKGNKVSKVEQEHIVKTGDASSGYTYEVSGAQFKLSSYGVYTVTFKAQDYAGNIVIRSYGIRVNDKTAPTITIVDEDKFNDSIEVGEYFEVPTATLKKEGGDVEGTTRWEIYNKSAGAECQSYNNGFIPTSEGTFFIRYYGVDELGNETKLEDSTFTVTAKDTIAPTIEIDNRERLEKEVVWNPATGTDYMTINIPVAFATDKNRGQVEVVYTVTGPNGIKPTVSDHETYGHLKTFKATSEGTYTLVYSAVDEAGNESKVEETICVGDCVAPTIEWSTEKPKVVKLNETYTLNTNELILKDYGINASSEADLRERITVTLTSPDGTSVTNMISNNEGYKWEFTKTGNYTLKITVKDKVGNTTTETCTIEVPAEEVESKKVSPVLGTVLVVLSVVVLGGVIVYFVASNKKKPSKKSASKK